MHDGDRPSANGPEAAAAPGNPARRLFLRLFLINGLLFGLGTLVLALSPATVSSPVLILEEVPILVIGLSLILATNALLVRASLAPLQELSALMQRADLLRSGDRMTEQGTGDLSRLIGTFNTMLDRLEAERSASSAETLAAQEAERERIARELHDEIGQNLTVVLLGLKRTIDRAPEGLRGELHDTQESVRRCVEQVRQVARRLRPGELAELGLRSALISLCSEFAQISGVRVRKAIANNLPSIGHDTELVAYRIAQESLTNVLRHAQATNVIVELGTHAAGQTLRIIDDGRGGIIEEGTGIRGMHERAALVGARLTIKTDDPEGTEVRLDLPIDPNGAPR
ncbi:sensor histidine kinase [Sciscionella marina]|uniref:sensor histidine kinase n=1 Tax=Sciscionella marina TaxID=508770 RepID=UPI00036B6852|nr:sensor histidine kinase [Sciscionella marina]